MCKFQKRKYILNLTLVIGMNLKYAGTRNRGGSSHQRAGFSPASAVWPSRGLHILERDKAEKPTGIDVYEFVPFASDFLLTFKLDGESCLFLQLFCQNQLLQQQRRACWAAAGGGREARRQTEAPAGKALPPSSSLFYAVNALRIGAGSSGQNEPVNWTPKILSNPIK